MPRHNTRSLAAIVAVAALVAVTAATPAAAHPHGPSNDEYTFAGGGWGHGAGMSQYGALGRAEAGQDHSEILAFYYEGTGLRTDPGLVPDDLDIRIAVHNTTVFKPAGLLTVAMDGRFLDTTRNTLTVRRGDGGWHINSSNIDWCRGFCSGTMLTVSFTEGERVRVSDTANGTQYYGYGQFQLTPASSGAANCGDRTASEYCLVIGDMTMQQYLYGIDEVPGSWPAEAQKAQAIAARSFATAQIRDRADSGAPFDLFTSTQDQEYRGWDRQAEASEDRPWQKAVDATDDTVLVRQAPDQAQPEVITALYSSSNGGHTAANEEPNRAPLPYLRAKPDPFDAAPDEQGDPQNPFHSWQRTYTTEQISRWLADYPFADLDVGEVREIYITGEGPSGRIDDARVTVVGSKRALRVLDDDGESYGYRFYYALVLGCRNTPGCEPLLSTKLKLQGAHSGDELDVHNLPFNDVEVGAPYAEAVAWMLDSEITSGTSPTAFSPDRPITRSQFATMLWRLAGRPVTVDASQTFDDVSEDASYFEAVDWLVREGVTTGCKSGDVRLFCPTEVMTAPQVAAFLWRFAGKKYSNHPIPFSDVGVNDYFLEAARWMVEHDLWLDGSFKASDGSEADFGRSEPVTRGRVASYLWRLAGTPGAFGGGVPLPPLMRDR